jgi:hypothetical protein
MRNKSGKVRTLLTFLKKENSEDSYNKEQWEVINDYLASGVVKPAKVRVTDVESLKKLVENGHSMTDISFPKRIADKIARKASPERTSIKDILNQYWSFGTASTNSIQESIDDMRESLAERHSNYN